MTIIKRAGIIEDWRIKYRPLMPNEAAQSRDGIVQSIEAFPLEILNRMNTEGYSSFTMKDVAALVILLESATVVYWKHEYWVAALSGRDAFAGTTPDFTSVTPRRQIFIPDVDFDVDPHSSRLLMLGRNVVLTGMFLCNTEKALEVCGIFNPSHRDQPELTTETYPEFVPTFRLWHFPHGKAIDTPVGCMIAALVEFMNQPFVGMDAVVPDRPERRRMMKKGKKWPEVRRIVLRRAIPQSINPPKKQKDIEWSCNWMVSAHWRKQYYPSTGERTPKFIKSYLKGDENKPFKPPAKTIISVER